MKSLYKVHIRGQVIYVVADTFTKAGSIAADHTQKAGCARPLVREIKRLTSHVLGVD